MINWKEIVERNAPESILKGLMDAYDQGPSLSKYALIAVCFIHAGLKRINQELPGNPAIKDFSDETIGERAVRLIAENPTMPVAHVIDCVIADKVVDNMLNALKK